MNSHNHDNRSISSSRMQDFSEEEKKQFVAFQENLKKIQKDEPRNLREHLQAINDGVIAIIITIIVLEIHPALQETGYHHFIFEIMVFLISFFIIADFWYDLHLIYSYHILNPQKGTAIANFAFLADLALLPVMTKWIMQEQSTLAVANFGIVFLFAKILEYLVRYIGTKQTLSNDYNAIEPFLRRVSMARGIIIIIFNLILIGLAFFIPKLVILLYVAIPIFSVLHPIQAD